MKYENLLPLLAWAERQGRKPKYASALKLSLECDNQHLLGPMTLRLRDALTAFRHLRQDARLRVCERFLRGRG